ncbi:MAG: MerR family transcriptional regulator [Oenococcus oeni]
MLIKGASKIIGISAYNIRYYEKIGLINIPRSRNGKRNFDEESIWKLTQILYFRNAGVALKDIRTMFEERMSEEIIMQVLYKAQKNIAKQLENIEKTQNYLDYKINWHLHHNIEVTTKLCGITVPTTKD